MKVIGELMIFSYFAADSGRQLAVETGEFEDIECGYVAYVPLELSLRSC